MIDNLGYNKTMKEHGELLAQKTIAITGIGFVTASQIIEIGNIAQSLGFIIGCFLLFLQAIYVSLKIRDKLNKDD